MGRAGLWMLWCLVAPLHVRDVGCGDCVPGDHEYEIMAAERPDPSAAEYAGGAARIMFGTQDRGDRDPSVKQPVCKEAP